MRWKYLPSISVISLYVFLPLQRLNLKQKLKHKHNYTQSGNHCGRGGGRQSGQLIFPGYQPDRGAKELLSSNNLRVILKNTNKLV